MLLIAFIFLFEVLRCRATLWLFMDTIVWYVHIPPDKAKSVLI